jgi:hypothetical protein
MAAERIRMTPATPPAWAEALLRLFVTPSRYDNVSGDLLEEYRDSVLPTRGPHRADLWYVTQVLGFMSRGAGLWAALFGAAFIARTAMDWLDPTVDFHARSMVSTLLGIGILLVAGFAAGRRSGSIAAGTALALATTAVGAAISIIGAAALLATWHDPGTMAAIRGSGGLSEAFTLPIMMVVPGAVFGTVGGAAGAIVRRVRAA